MLATVPVVGLVVIAALGAVLLGALLRAYWEFHGVRVVTCPETRAPVAVEIAAWRAALSRLVGEPRLRISDCSRWPERHPCGQECLAALEAAPADCLLRTMIDRWYQGQACAGCGRPLEPRPWQARPALLDQEGRSWEWVQIRPEAVPETLKTCRPVCWDCHAQAAFRRVQASLPAAGVAAGKPREVSHAFQSVDSHD